MKHETTRYVMTSGVKISRDKPPRILNHGVCFPSQNDDDDDDDNNNST